MGIKLFDDSFYSAGGGIPEGDYALEFNICMHQSTNKTTGAPVGQPRLGVMVKFYPIDEDGKLVGEPKEKHYGMGSNAHQSFAPDPDTGKGLVVVPGGKYSTIMGNTNWAMFRKSMIDAGLPPSVVENDLSVIDGTWAHIMNVPEPEERKSFTAKTGEATEEERKGNGLVAVVSEIKENGKPWEGTGGIPEAEEEKPAPKAAPKPAAKPAAKLAAKPAAKPAAKVVPVQEEVDDDAQTLAINFISEVLEKNPNGLKKLKLRTDVFKAAGEAHREAVMSVFGDEAALATIIGGLGYEIAGTDVKPA